MRHKPNANRRCPSISSYPQPDNDGQAYCPKCGSRECYQSRRQGALRWQCKGCHKDFSLTSGTLFASHKMPLRAYLMAIAVFLNEVKGKSMLALSRDLGTDRPPFGGPI